MLYHVHMGDIRGEHDDTRRLLPDQSVQRLFLKDHILKYYLVSQLLYQSGNIFKLNGFAGHKIRKAQ